MWFDWDPAKAARNRRKHGVSFEEASSVFYDPHALTRFDEEHSDEESRWQTVGTSNRLRVLIVVSTERHEDVVWIISARKATRKEVQRYEEAKSRSSRG